MSTSPPAELQAITELYRALFRDAPGPVNDTAWFTHGLVVGALLGMTDAAAARRYVAAVVGDAHGMTGVASSTVEAEYRRAAGELA
jgi:hypothetical protein